MSVNNEVNKQALYLSGFVGLIASILVGAGEFLLHFDPMARYSESSYDFMLATSDEQQTLGHFLAVFGAPLYIVGCWHIYLMLKSANQKLAFITFLISAYGFMIGADWISSRASIGALIHQENNARLIAPLVELYIIRYESLLVVIRFTTATLSFLYIGLILTGKTQYKHWHTIPNPVCLLLACFAIYALNPSIGKYIMPIAMNVAFGIFFIISLIQVKNL